LRKNVYFIAPIWPEDCKISLQYLKNFGLETHPQFQNMTCITFGLYLGLQNYFHQIVFKGYTLLPHHFLSVSLKNIGGKNPKGAPTPPPIILVLSLSRTVYLHNSMSIPQKLANGNGTENEKENKTR